jgi:hypothetical protein
MPNYMPYPWVASIVKIFNSKTNQKLKDKKTKMCKCTLTQAWVSAAPRSCSALGCYVGPVFRGWYAFFSVVLTAEGSSMIFLYNIYIHQLDYMLPISRRSHYECWRQWNFQILKRISYSFCKFVIVFKVLYGSLRIGYWGSGDRRGCGLVILAVWTKAHVFGTIK